MKKRIHLHQLRPGMYVEEIEGLGAASGTCRQHFLINSTTDLEHLLASRAMSAVINLSKGADIDGGAPAGPQIDLARHETELLLHYSSEQIARARATIVETAPHVTQLLRQAHDQKSVNIDGARDAVSAIMTETSDNAGALIGLFKLKQKDEVTFLHSLSVSALMVTFGRALDLDEDMVRLLGVGGLVHDIGKMVIPKGVLSKAGDLSDRERAMIRSHPERGYQMLRRVPGIGQEVLDICRLHHEKFDGSGYPLGLRADAIPFAARVAAICDVYDALTTKRSYKKAWTQAEAIDRMLQATGHFDPDLMKKFVSRMVVSGAIT